MTRLVVRPATPQDADAMVGVIRKAFGARPVLVPPSTATSETSESVAAAVAAHGGVVAWLDDRAAGALWFARPEPGVVTLNRVAVDPDTQGHGVATAMVGLAETLTAESGDERIELIARTEMPANLEFWARRGFARVGGEPPLLRLGKAVRRDFECPRPSDLQDLGRRLSAHLRAGDVLLLTGPLGAGKTTFTQGIGRGLGVRGDVTSPTFVIARSHPSTGDGPALLHVDAYRLGGSAELDDLDLDTPLTESVTVVEWGAGLADALAVDRLEITITRPDEAAGNTELEPRQVRIHGIGARWARTGLGLG